MEIDFQMEATKNKCRWKLLLLLCFVMILALTVGFIVTDSNSALEGIFTNSKSEDYPSFLSVEFRGDTFITTMNIPIPYGEIPEHISDRVQLSEYGGYFIQIVQRGNFLINNEVYTEGITLLFPCGGVRHHPFTRTRNSITVGQSQLIALR